MAEGVPDVSKSPIILTPLRKFTKKTTQELPAGFDRILLTPILLECVEQLTFHPETWIEFPVATDDSELTEEQEQHAYDILHAVKRFSEMRDILCTSCVQEKRFWKIYFLLVANFIKTEKSTRAEAEKTISQDPSPPTKPRSFSIKPLWTKLTQPHDRERAAPPPAVPKSVQEANCPPTLEGGRSRGNSDAASDDWVVVDAVPTICVEHPPHEKPSQHSNPQEKIRQLTEAMASLPTSLDTSPISSKPNPLQNSALFSMADSLSAADLSFLEKAKSSEEIFSHVPDRALELLSTEKVCTETDVDTMFTDLSDEDNYFDEESFVAHSDAGEAGQLL